MKRRTMKQLIAALVVGAMLFGTLGLNGELLFAQETGETHRA